MRKLEQRLWDRMRKHLLGVMYVERVENVVSPGRPDVDVMIHGVTLPIELKAVANYPVRPSTPVLGRAHGLNVNQLNWWLRWQRLGGVGAILIGVRLDIYLVPGKHADEVNGWTQDQLSKYQQTWDGLWKELEKGSQCVLYR
jgi:hypothetical protein